MTKNNSNATWEKVSEFLDTLGDELENLSSIIRDELGVEMGSETELEIESNIRCFPAPPVLLDRKLGSKNNGVADLTCPRGSLSTNDSGFLI